MKFKIGNKEISFERKKTIKETIKFNLIYGLILVLIPYILISIIIFEYISEFIIKSVTFILASVIIILALSYLEFISRKVLILNKIFYALYQIAISFLVISAIFTTLLVMISILFPLKWG